MYRIYMETSRYYPGILEMTLQRGRVGRPIKVLHPLHISGFRGKWINLAVGFTIIPALYFSLQDCILQYWNTFLTFSLIIDVLHDRKTFLELFGISPTVVRSFSLLGNGSVVFSSGFFGDPTTEVVLRGEVWTEMTGIFLATWTTIADGQCPCQTHKIHVYLPTFMVDFHGFHVGKYTIHHGAYGKGCNFKNFRIKT